MIAAFDVEPLVLFTYLLISKQTLKYNLAFSYRLNASCEVLYLLSLSPLSLSLSLIMVQ